MIELGRMPAFQTSARVSRRGFLGIAAAALTTGCVTSPPPIPLDEAKSWKVVSVEGTLAPAASSSWMSARSEFMKANGLEAKVEYGDRETPTRVIEPELPREQYRAFIAAQFSSRVRTSFPAKMQSAFTGTRPVKIVVTMHGAEILDPGQLAAKVFFGGQSAAQHALLAHIDVIDARSGKILVTYPITRVTVSGVRGFDFNGGAAAENDPMLKMLNQLREQFLRWLLQTA